MQLSYLPCTAEPLNMFPLLQVGGVTKPCELFHEIGKLESADQRNADIITSVATVAGPSGRTV
jgi:hypothetical protein